jgi:uncharacterized membrane protein YqjE
MHTPETETQANAGVGPAAKQVAEHASTLARLELELATLELKKKAARFGAGIGLGLGAALFAVFMLGFLFASIAAGLATVVPTWAALLITTGILLLLAAILGSIAALLINKSTPPVPEQAIEEARRTTEALKRNGSP